MIQLPTDWQDYALIDAGDGEKLERWGQIVTIRPDPQAIWPRVNPSAWQSPHMYYHRSKAGGGHWENHLKTPGTWDISYDKLRFKIKPTGFKHMGLFPEQAVNWRWMTDKISFADRPVKILNLFAYTGGATVACLAAGASVTHIDAAKGMNAQAKENITISGLADTPHRVLADDVMKFVQRESRRGSLYDGIIMDPPVYGRGPKGEMWKLEERLYELAKAAAAILTSNPLFFLINAYTAGLSPAVYGNILQLLMDSHGGHTGFGEVGLKAESGIILPCGMYARWCVN